MLFSAEWVEMRCDDDNDNGWKMKEKGALAYFKQFPQNSPGGTEDNNENLHLRQPICGPVFELGTSRMQVSQVKACANLLRGRTWSMRLFYVSHMTFDSLPLVSFLQWHSAQYGNPHDIHGQLIVYTITGDTIC
jgi:hypothetical protein